MLVELTKCEENSNVDPPQSDILFSSNMDSSTLSIGEPVGSKKSRNVKSKSILIEDVVNRFPTKSCKLLDNS